MMQVRTFVRGLAAMMMVAALGLVTGCESDGGGGGGSSGGGSVVGRWELTSQADGGKTWWAFNEDGSYVMYNDSGFSSKHLAGTYTQDGKSVKGPFSNPGVGDGEIDATVSDDGKSLQLDFIEHWHSPYKHVPLAGPKL